MSRLVGLRSAFGQVVEWDRLLISERVGKSMSGGRLGWGRLELLQRLIKLMLKAGLDFLFSVELVTEGGEA